MSDQPPRKWPADEPERKPLLWLKASPRNARTHSKEQISQIRSSIERFGWTTPVLAREDGTIIAGHGRVEAAKLIDGLTEAPVIIARGWTEDECRAYALADNRIPMNAGWDGDLLASEMVALAAVDYDLVALGFSPQDLNTNLRPPAGDADPEDVPPPPCGSGITRRRRVAVGQAPDTLRRQHQSRRRLARAG